MVESLKISNANNEKRNGTLRWTLEEAVIVPGAMPFSVLEPANTLVQESSSRTTNVEVPPRSPITLKVKLQNSSSMPDWSQASARTPWQGIFTNNPQPRLTQVIKAHQRDVTIVKCTRYGFFVPKQYPLHPPRASIIHFHTARKYF